MILDFMKKFKSVEEKKKVIFETYLNFFKDLSETTLYPYADMSYFLQARNAYKTNVKSLKDINFLYNKIINK